MEAIKDTLKNGIIIGLVTGAIAGVATFGGRCVFKLTHLSYKSVAWTATAFAVASLIVSFNKHVHSKEGSTKATFGFFVGGIALATFFNKVFVDKNLSILSSAATPTISAIGLCCLSLSIKN